MLVDRVCVSLIETLEWLVETERVAVLLVVLCVELKEVVAEVVGGLVTVVNVEEAVFGLRLHESVRTVSEREVELESVGTAVRVVRVVDSDAVRDADARECDRVGTERLRVALRVDVRVGGGVFVSEREPDCVRLDCDIDVLPRDGDRVRLGEDVLVRLAESVLRLRLSVGRLSVGSVLDFVAVGGLVTVVIVELSDGFDSEIERDGLGADLERVGVLEPAEGVVVGSGVTVVTLALSLRERVGVLGGVRVVRERDLECDGVRSESDRDEVRLVGVTVGVPAA